jgi:tetratricopeptide (TPR) repeat protein
MPLQASGDFGAQRFAGTNRLSIHDHLFPAANTGLAHLRGASNIVERQEEFLRGSVRVDIFGLKVGGAVDSPLVAPLRPNVPTLKRGATYLLEVVLRTLRLGHPFTQGTTDSNEVWVEAGLLSEGRTFGRSGGLGPHREVDPWAHFVNTYMLDRRGNRIDRRNPQDIFTPLYNHQIPPGASQVVHYRFTVPPEQQGPLTVEVRLNYRKFDTIYMNYVRSPGYTNGMPFAVTNDLPITVLASDRLVFPVEDHSTPTKTPEQSIPTWQRWNDYGIALLLEGDRGSEKGELAEAERALVEVERLGRADGPLNLARVSFKEGRVDEAVEALRRASDSGRFNPPGPRWTIAWLSGLVDKQNGQLDAAIENFRSVLEDRTPEMEQRRFDFSQDYEVINELGLALFERSKMEHGDNERRMEFLRRAAAQFERSLSIDSENLTAHHNLALISESLGDSSKAALHRRLHERYRPDDNARDYAIQAARRASPTADHAAQAIVIYSLQRDGFFACDTRKPQLPGPSPHDSRNSPTAN